jgi:chromosome segregation ATPase
MKLWIKLPMIKNLAILLTLLVNPALAQQALLGPDRQMQRQLQILELYSGNIDGDVGTGTVRAIRQFEEENGLQDNGNLDSIDLQLLEQEVMNKAVAESSVTYQGAGFRVNFPETFINSLEIPSFEVALYENSQGSISIIFQDDKFGDFPARYLKTYWYSDSVNRREDFLNFADPLSLELRSRMYFACASLADVDVMQVIFEGSAITDDVLAQAFQRSGGLSLLVAAARIGKYCSEDISQYASRAKLMLSEGESSNLTESEIGSPQLDISGLTTETSESSDSDSSELTAETFEQDISSPEQVALLRQQVILMNQILTTLGENTPEIQEQLDVDLGENNSSTGNLIVESNEHTATMQDLDSVREQLFAANTTIADLQSQKNVLEQRLDEALGENNSSTGNLIVESNEHAATMQEMASVREQLFSANTTIVDLQSQKNVLEERLDEALGENNSSTGNLIVESNEHAATMQEMASVREQLFSANTTIVDLQSQKNVLEGRLDEALGENNSSTGNLIIEANEHSATMQELESVREQLSAANSTLFDIQSQRRALEVNLSEVNSLLANVLPQLDDRTNQLEAANSVMVDLQSTKQDLLRRLDVLENNLSASRSTAAELSSDLESSRTLLDSLNQTLSDLQIDRDLNFVELERFNERSAQVEALNSTLVDKDTQVRRLQAANAELFGWCQTDLDCKDAFGLR